MKIPNFRPGLDIEKIKDLYESLSQNVSINEKDYTYTISLKGVHVLLAMDPDSKWDSEYIRFEYDSKGNLKRVLIEEDVLWEG